MNENIWRINCKSVDAFDKNINKFIFVLFNLLVYCNVTIGPPCIVAIFHRFEQETKIDLEGKSGGEGEEGREKNLFEATFQEWTGSRGEDHEPRHFDEWCIPDCYLPVESLETFNWESNKLAKQWSDDWKFVHE